MNLTCLKQPIQPSIEAGLSHSSSACHIRRKLDHYRLSAVSFHCRTLVGMNTTGWSPPSSFPLTSGDRGSLTLTTGLSGSGGLVAPAAVARPAPLTDAVLDNNMAIALQTHVIGSESGSSITSRQSSHRKPPLDLKAATLKAGRARRQAEAAEAQLLAIRLRGKASSENSGRSRGSRRHRTRGSSSPAGPGSALVPQEATPRAMRTYTVQSEQRFTEGVHVPAVVAELEAKSQAVHAASAYAFAAQAE